MKSPNAEINKKIQRNALIFQAMRRSDFPTQVRVKMIEKGLRNIDLAERIGVSEANISRWLRGNQNLSLDTIYQLADAIEEPLTLAIGSQIKKLESAGSDSESDATNNFQKINQNKDKPLSCEMNIVNLDSYKALRASANLRETAVFFTARGDSDAKCDELRVS